MCGNKTLLLPQEKHELSGYLQDLWANKSVVLGKIRCRFTSIVYKNYRQYKYMYYNSYPEDIMQIIMQKLSNKQDPHTGIYTEAIETVKASRQCKQYMSKAIQAEKKLHSINLTKKACFATPDVAKEILGENFKCREDIELKKINTLETRYKINKEHIISQLGSQWGYLKEKQISLKIEHRRSIFHKTKYIITTLPNNMQPKGDEHASWLACGNGDKTLTPEMLKIPVKDTRRRTSAQNLLAGKTIITDATGTDTLDDKGIEVLFGFLHSTK